MDEGLLSTRRVATLLGVCTKTLLNRRTTKSFPQPVSALGARKLQWRAADIRRYIETLRPR